MTFINKAGIKKCIFSCERAVGRLFYRKHVWLVSDRKMAAGDNGEAFFKYLQNKDVNAVFAISKDSPDYDRLKSIGKVVDYDCPMYKFLLCAADCHISSQLIHMETHAETPQIFLQHGVAEKDISKMINPVSHGNFYIITSSKQERDYMLGDNFTISPDHVWLTGLTRFDYLKNAPKKLMVVAFTWRAALAGVEREAFGESDYYRTISRIMHDTELTDRLGELGYKLSVRLHPEMDYLKDMFEETSGCSFYRGSYNRMYEEAGLIVTDYSSAVFDFAYLKKPIIYYHFDGDGYYLNNPYTQKGFFDYEIHGFGPVIRDYEGFRDELIKMAENGCVMEDKYKKRVDDIFAYIDKHNCDRTFELIKKLLDK